MKQEEAIKYAKEILNTTPMSSPTPTLASSVFSSFKEDLQKSKKSKGGSEKDSKSWAYRATSASTRLFTKGSSASRAVLDDMTKMVGVQEVSEVVADAFTDQRIYDSLASSSPGTTTTTDTSSIWQRIKDSMKH